MTIEEAFNLAVQRHRAGQSAEAEAILRQILAQRPEDHQVYNALAVIAWQKGRYEEALESAQRAIALSPGSGDYQGNLCVILAAAGRLEEALAAAGRAVEMAPQSAHAWNNLGFVCCRLGRFEEGIDACRRALAIEPRLAGAHNNLGSLFLDSGRVDDAVECFEQAVALQQGFTDAYNNLGKALYRKDEADRAIVAFERALELQPGNAETLCNLGTALGEKQRPEEAIARYRQSIKVRPDYAAGHWNLSLALLRRGEFAEGWREYDWRFRVETLRERIRFSQPWWDGGDLCGRRLLIHAEQGFGDTIQFVRYIPTLAGRGGRIILACQPELLALVKQVRGFDEFVDGTGPLPAFDVHCPLLSLPRIFQTTVASIPAVVPYLAATEDCIERWRQRMEGEAGLKIGLAWAGRATNDNDRRRSFPAKIFAPLAEVPGVRLFSVQKGERAGEGKELKLIDFSTELGDFAETAGLIAHLDLIICADTAVAHLAGAMGKAVWVMLPVAADWRWMLGREDSPWYPTMRLFRQKAGGDWGGVMEEIVAGVRGRLDGV